MTHRRFGTAAGTYALAAALVGGSSTMAWAAGGAEPGGTPSGGTAPASTAPASTAPARATPAGTAPATTAPASSTPGSTATGKAPAAPTMPGDSAAVTRFAGGLDLYGVWRARKRVCLGERATGPDGLETGDWVADWCSTPGATGGPLLSAWQVGDGDVVPTVRLLTLPRRAVGGHVGGVELGVVELGEGVRVALVAGAAGDRLVLHDRGGRVIVDRPLGAVVDAGQFFARS